jgi:hypothetical protein
MHKRLTPFLVALSLSMAGCPEHLNGYSSAASISQNGYARDGASLRKANGQAVKLWGYVDHGNLYGDEGAKKILGQWWSGAGPSATLWRFNLKAKAEDETGRSFAVWVPNGPGRDALLKAFLADAKAGRPTRVFLKAKVFSFDAPSQAGTLTGLHLDVASSRDITLGVPLEK